MLQRLHPLSRALTALPRRTGVRHMGSGFKPDTQVALETRARINDMPVPQGSWQEHYNKRNTKWNMYIVASSILCVLSWAAAYKAGVWLPHDIKDYKKVQINPT